VSVPVSELGPPTPSPASECVSPLDPMGVGGWEQNSLACERGPNSDAWTERLALCIPCGSLRILLQADEQLMAGWVASRNQIQRSPPLVFYLLPRNLSNNVDRQTAPAIQC
jgi:hypothetical protein